MSENSLENLIGQSAVEKPSSGGDISKVADVQVTLCAELGRTKLPLKDIIEYDSGSIITLDKTTTSPVDVYVDDILIARGKIVAIEDTYGIKIVEIVEQKQAENKVK